MALADNFGHIVESIDNTVRANIPAPGIGLLFAYAFAGQIYCDFSAYTDIAAVSEAGGRRVGSQLPHALFLRLSRRVLAALAYFAVYLAARLSVHPARRQSLWPLGRVPQPHDPDDAGGPWHGAGPLFILGGWHGLML